MKKIYALLLICFVSSCGIIPPANKNEFKFDIEDFKSASIKRYPVDNYAYSIKLSLTGELSDSTKIGWGSVSDSGKVQPYQIVPLKEGKVNYEYSGDFYGREFYFDYTPIGDSSVNGKLKAHVVVYVTKS